MKIAVSSCSIDFSELLVNDLTPLDSTVFHFEMKFELIVVRNQTGQRTINTHWAAAAANGSLLLKIQNNFEALGMFQVGV